MTRTVRVTVPPVRPGGGGTMTVQPNLRKAFVGIGGGLLAMMGLAGFVLSGRSWHRTSALGPARVVNRGRLS